MSSHQKPFILVDGSSYLYRAFHALPALSNSQGLATGAIYGVINMLKRLLTDYQPDYMAVIFDAKGKTFRNDLYPAYKATRKAMPPELAEQIEPLHHLIKALGIPLIMIEGVEADDVIGTLAVANTHAKHPTLISTGDKDLAQLVNEHVTLINTMSNTKLDPQGVQEKFGVAPSQIIDYLTLVGDTSDNIPGVPKVGPKTAAKWLQTYGSLDNIIKHAQDIGGKVGESLQNFINHQLAQTRQLVTIKCDVPLPIQITELTLSSHDQSRLIEMYKTLEFKTWLREALDSQTPTKASVDRYSDYRLVLDEAELKHIVQAIHQTTVLVVDTETTSLDYMQAKLVGIALADGKMHACYIPFGHDYVDAPKQLSQTQVLNALKPILENPHIKKIGQHIKYDIEVLENHGIHLQGIYFDTMLASYVLDSASNNHNMDTLALKYLGIRTITFEDVAGKGVKQLTFNQVALDKAAQYAAEDADITLQLYHHFAPLIKKEKGLNAIFQNIEMPLTPILAEMELTGVLIDPVKLQKQGEALQKRLQQLADQAYNIAGERFNINSPKQLQVVLYEQLKLPILQKTPTGQASTADNVLQELAHEFEIANVLIEYRSISKLISTYTSRLVEQIDPVSGRIHTSYNQTGTGTGRLSSSNPNLQNIPIRTEEGKRIRQAFIAKPGYQLISADYSQIELRLIAHITEDANLLAAFAKNIDIHQATAAEVFGVTLEKVTQDMRRNAKAINFGLLYGMSAFGLTQQLGIDRKAAQRYIDKYFERYPTIRAYIDSIRATAKEKGYVETIFGRKLVIPNINSPQIMRQKAAERAAINAPLQGSAADIIKLAMISIAHWFKSENIDAKMIMQVHDELVFEAKTDDVNAIIAGVDRRMSAAASLKVPLLVSIGVGNNWDEASAH